MSDQDILHIDSEVSFSPSSSSSVDPSGQVKAGDVWTGPAFKPEDWESNFQNYLRQQGSDKPSTSQTQAKPSVKILENIQLIPPHDTTNATTKITNINCISLISTPYTKTITEKPAVINNHQVTDLSRLRLTTTIQECEMRASNSVQRFRTQDGVDIYIPKEVLDRVNLRDIQATKNKIKTINLPDRYQVQLKIRPNGRLIFHHYKKRGLKRIMARLNQRVQRGENVRRSPKK